MLSASVLLQVLVLPLAGAFADRSGRKREMLAGFAFLGALATTGMFFVGDGRWLLGAVLFVVANISFGAATVVYYSWLPDLAGPDERDAVSSRGWAFGYVGGALLLAVHLGLVLSAESLGLTTGEAVRICLATAGLWWGAFTVFSVSRLRNRPVRESAARSRSGFRQLATTLREMRAFPLTLWFLGAYLLFNDGVQTVIALSATYATEELGLDQSVLTGAILMVQVVAIAGALGLGRLAGRYGAKRVVLGALVAWILVLVAAYFLQENAVGQFYALAAVIGLVQGGTQALSRSLFSQLIPAGKEAEYYGFYEISDRGTSWLGPPGVRAHLSADRLVPAGDHQPGHLLRGRVRRPGRAADAPRRRRGGEHSRRSACDSGRTPLPRCRWTCPPSCRPRATGAGTPRRRTCASSTARWTAASRPSPSRSTTTRAARAGTACC